MIRKIRDLLYEQGFTISGARNKMQEIQELERDKKRSVETRADGSVESLLDFQSEPAYHFQVPATLSDSQWQQVRDELLEIRAFLVVA